MNTKSISRKTPQWGTLTVLGAVTVAPLLSAPHTVEAAPAVRYAQATRRVVSLSGVVIGDLAGREFRMRSSDGREFRVVIDQGHEPRALSRNDRVTVRGYFTSGIFIANTVSVTSQGTVGTVRPGSTRATSLSGVVIGDLAGREFRMRSNDGREFRVVVAAGREPRALSRNDRVTVNGYFSSGIFLANNVSITSHGTVGTVRPGTTRSTWLSGVVIGDLAGREFRMRSSDGREFRVIVAQGHEPRRLSRGDRVQVTGYFSSGIFLANNVNITSNVGAYPLPGSGQGRVDLTGTVISKASSTRYGIRATNGINYSVQSSTRPASTIYVGNVIRVIGWRSGSTIRAERILLVRRSGTWTNQNGRAVNFTGTVTRVARVFGVVGDLDVRSSSGVTYRVRTRNITNFRVGQHVRVIGTYSGATINATSVTRIY